MRKTIKCDHTALRPNAGVLTVRTCERTRFHPGDHHDKHGNWSDQTQPEAEVARA